jgi:hypothetical protein
VKFGDPVPKASLLNETVGVLDDLLLGVKTRSVRRLKQLVVGHAADDEE